MNVGQLQLISNDYWAEYINIFPELGKFQRPIIKVNNRFTKTGGINRSELNTIELAGKYFANNTDTMINIILPHEIAHQIDHNLNGWHTGKKHHGKTWQEIMVLIDQIPNPYHYMVL